MGRGHMEAPNGATYEGKFHKGLPNGLGVMIFTDSSRYEGEFMQGWFHGHGVFSTIDGTKFEGKALIKCHLSLQKQWLIFRGISRGKTLG